MRIIVTVSLILVLSGLAFGANEFQVKGTVSKIEGNRITVKDEKGRESSIESSISGIKAGDAVLLKGEIIKVESLRTTLTLQDTEFLTKQCQIQMTDAQVIPQLEEKTRLKLFSLIDRKDCKLLDPFKASRAYFRSLKPKTKLPMPPAGWDTHYLTDREFEQYTDIIANVPW